MWATTMTTTVLNTKVIKLSDVCRVRSVVVVYIPCLFSLNLCDDEMEAHPSV
jgi:hypothetical protein